jgi:hypothetical protein
MPWTEGAQVAGLVGSSRARELPASKRLKSCLGKVSKRLILWTSAAVAGSGRNRCPPAGCVPQSSVFFGPAGGSEYVQEAGIELAARLGTPQFRRGFLEFPVLHRRRYGRSLAHRNSRLPRVLAWPENSSSYELAVLTASRPDLPDIRPLRSAARRRCTKVQALL